MNGSIPPTNKPTITLGSSKSMAFTPTAFVKDTNNASAVSAAEPIANPLPIAAVVFPTESKLSVMSRTLSSSQDI